MTTRPYDPVLRGELLEMQENDRVLRAELARDGSLFQGYHPRMKALHDSNAQAFQALLGDRWPTVDEVQRDGQEAAFVVVQHCIGQPSFQRHYLGILRRAVAAGEASGAHLAMLEDRIRFFEGRLQVYGTQFDWDEGGQMSPLPSEDPANLDQRRRAVGLEPIAVATARHRAAAKERGEGPPANRAARQEGFEAWARATGWRS